MIGSEKLSKNNQSKYLKFFAHLSDGVLFGSLITQEIIEVNNALLKLSGYGENELKQLKIDELLVDQSHVVIGEEGSGQFAEGYLRCKNGSILIVEMSGMMIDEEDLIFGLVIRNVTQQKAKFKSLHALQDLMATMSQISRQFMNIEPDALFETIYQVLMEIADFSGFFSVFLFEYSDSTLSEVQNRFYWPRQSDLAIDDYFDGVSDESKAMMLARFIAGEPFILDKEEIATLMSMGDGFKRLFSKGTVSAGIIPIKYENELVGLMGLEVNSVDFQWHFENLFMYRLVGEILISALEHKRQEDEIKRSEKNYRDLINSSPSGILVMCPKTILLANKKMNQLFGLYVDAPAEEFYELIHEYNYYRTIDLIKDLSTSDVGMMVESEIVCYDASKNEHILEIKFQKIDYDCELAVMLMINDVTQQRKLEEERENDLRYSMALDQVSRLAAAAQNKEKTLQMIADSLGSLLDADGCFISLWDNEKNLPIPAAAYGPYQAAYPKVSKEQNEPTLTEAVLAAGKTIVVRDTSNHSAISPRIAEMFTSKSMIGIPLIVENEKLGAALISYDEHQDFSDEDVKRAESLVGPLVLAFRKAQFHEDLAAAYEETLLGWGNAIELREDAARGHSLRVAKASIQIAETMGFSKEDISNIRRGAFLHDIGKMGIPDNVLKKPGKLTPEERAIMERHSLIGAQFLRPIKFLKDAIDIPLYHHEKWDGTGYPYGLAGENIPIAARIFSIVDVWDALSSVRPYKKPWPNEKIRAYLLECAGTHFDPNLVDVFIEFFDGLTPAWFQDLSM